MRESPLYEICAHASVALLCVSKTQPTNGFRVSNGYDCLLIVSKLSTSVVKIVMDESQ